MNSKYVWNGKEVDRKTWWTNRLQMVVEDPTNAHLKDLLMELDTDVEIGHSMYSITPEEVENGADVCRVVLADHEQVALGNLGVTLCINEALLKSNPDGEYPEETIWNCLEGGLKALNNLTRQLPRCR